MTPLLGPTKNSETLEECSIRFGNASSNESEEDSPAMKFIALGLTASIQTALGDVAEIKDAVGIGS